MMNGKAFGLWSLGFGLGELWSSGFGLWALASVNLVL